MAKKIYFATLNNNVVATINNVFEVYFAHAFVKTQLSAEYTALDKTLKALKEAEILGDATREDILSVQNKINVNVNKKKALVAWRKNTLYTHKSETSDEWVKGLYDDLGVTKEFAEVWAQCRSAKTYGKWNEAIRKMLAEVYGMDFKDDKLPSKLANYLEHVIGENPASDKEILNGILLKDKTAYSKFAELFVRALVGYIAQTCDKVAIPTQEFYKAEVEFDKDIREVVSYKVVEKVEEEPAPAVEEEPKAEAPAPKTKKSSKKLNK